MKGFGGMNLGGMGGLGGFGGMAKEEFKMHEDDND